MLINDDETADVIGSIRIHGKGTDKYDNIRVGMNSRLDTLQAAILLPKLSVFADDIDKRNVVASRYNTKLANSVSRYPRVIDGGVSTWAQYTIEVDDPLQLGAALKEKGIPTARYYPKPVHMQTAYSHFPSASMGLQNTMNCIEKIISLPMHPYLDEQTQDMIADAVIEAVH